MLQSALQGILEYFNLLFAAIGYALRLDPLVYEAAITHPRSVEIIAGIIFLAGMSMLLGQSVILFVNKVRRGRFVFSMLTNGLIFLITYLLWGLAVAIIGYFMFNVPIVRLIGVAWLIGLSTAPLVFGFLILIPYMGTGIGKVLSVWQVLIMTTVVQFAFEVDFIPAAVCVGVSWLFMLLLSNTIGKPVVKLRNFIYRKVTGSNLDATTQDILLEFSTGAGIAKNAPKGGQA